MQVFGRRDFQFLYNDCFTEHDRGKDGIARFLRITDEGVFYDDCLQEGGEALKSLRWKPVHELAGPNKPPSSGPALPFPFTAKELAAFMLWGYWASDFQNTFGLLDCGPNEFVLNGDHEDAADAYEALRQAYVIYRDALHVVGELDYQERQRAYDLRAQFSDAYDQALEREKVMERVITGCREDGSPEYGDFIQRDEYLLRLARAKELVASQKAQALQAEEQADAKERAWRRAMTRQLLQTKATTPSPAPVATDEIAFDMVATRQQLIDAFGSFTGMSIAWFDNLNTSPRLKAARKYTGQGGRHSAEPLFCPYEVMQWLADPKRKKGRKLGNEKAWQLLKAHFPKAYAPNSIGDPNAD